MLPFMEAVMGVEQLLSRTDFSTAPMHGRPSCSVAGALCSHRILPARYLLANQLRLRRCARSRHMRPAATSTSNSSSRALLSICPCMSRELCSRLATLISRKETVRRAVRPSKWASDVQGATFEVLKGEAKRRNQIDPSLDYTQPATGPRRYYTTTGNSLRKDGRNESEDLNVAARNALLNMIDHLVDSRGYTREQAYCITSVAVDLKVSQVVDVPNLVVSAFLPLDIFESQEAR